MKSPFVFVTCQVGAEPALKKEIAREHPELRFAFSRPGFVTFKRLSGELEPDFRLNSVFARAYGISFGKAESIQKVREFAQGRKVHLWQRDEYLPGDEPPGFDPEAWLEPYREIRGGEGPEVADVILVEEGQPWLGLHLQGPHHSPFPGGKPPLTLPAEAPSRAYLKLEEALLWSEAPIRPGDVALEIGSAPGGASYALLKHGVKVVGVDPAEMDPAVLGMKGFTHLRKTVNAIERGDLPQAVHWLLLDMNFDPEISLRAVERIAEMLKDSLVGMILTLKLNEWKLADRVPQYLERIKALGASKVRARQLAYNRQEFCVYALTRAAARRPGTAVPRA